MTETLGAMIAHLRIAHASNEFLTTETGETYTDLFCGAGTVFLGHGNPVILAGARAQLERVWNTGILPTAVRDDAHAQIDSLFPSSHRLAGLYSTGMEAAEFALRVARVVTGRAGVVGFDRSMHGKSMATAALSWTNDRVHLPDVHRLACLSASHEDEVLARVADTIADRSIAAVFVEPLAGSNGGHAASAAFHRSLAGLCRDHGTMLVFDEVLTGFHRTGGAFLFESLGVVPDIILIGKAMGNGFPVSGVVVDRRHEIVPPMLPGSTYAGNPLAAAIVATTLRHMRSLSLPTMVGQIADIVQRELHPVRELGITLRGMGAIWMLECPADTDATAIAMRALTGGVVVSPVGRWIRLFPPATISPDHLSRACTIVRDACVAWSQSDIMDA